MDLLAVVPLHKYPEYLTQCCKLINSEWKRSETARLRSLEASSDNLPTSLILLLGNQVVGHCKLSSIPSKSDACFVESVVVAKEFRGRGFGSFLMKKTEDYCKNVLRLNVIYLSTKGQEQFYSKLNYNTCEPISIYGSCSIPIKQTFDCSRLPSVNNVNRNATTKTYMNKFI